MPSQDFLATIKLVLDKTGLTSGLSSAKTEIQSLSKVPWDAKGFEQKVRDAFLKPIDEVKPKITESRSLFQEWGDIVRKAFMVAPVWMATREVIQQVNYFVQEGVQYYLETEKAILNVKTSLQDMGAAGEATVRELTDRFTALSAETGKSVANIANIYAGVNRILQNTQQSFLATNEAVKLSEATGADAGKIAETLSFMYKLQGDSLKGATTDAKKFQEISELLYTTQAKTPGGIEKLSADIRSFAGTMNVADFGIENTIKLFGALESSGISSSQTLKTGVMKVLTNIDEVSKMLGLDISKTTSPFQAFTMVLEKLGSAIKPGQLNANAFSVIKDIFGSGARGAGQITALAKDLDALKSALSGSGVSAKDRYMYQKQLEDVQNTSEHQIEIFQNLKKQAGDAFITGLVGGKDFADAMKNVNAIMTEMARVAGNVGMEIHAVSQAINLITSLGTSVFTDAANKRTEQAKEELDLQTRIQLAIKGQLSLSETNALVGDVYATKLITEEGQKQRILSLLQKQSIELMKQGKIQEANKANQEASVILAKKQADELENLVIQYAKASPSERGNIRRKIELSQMSEEAQVSAFQGGGTDRKLILEMFSKLSEETQKRITGLVAGEEGLNVGGRFGTSTSLVGNAWSGGLQGALPGNGKMISINPKAADTINISIAYEAGLAWKDMVKKTGQAVVDKLLKDEDIQKEIAKKLSPNM